jgi:hypothetical protein
LSLVEYIFCSSEKNHDTQARKIIVCFGEEITGTEVTNPKTVLRSGLGEDFGFRDNFYDIQAYGKLSGSKDW